MLTIRRHQLGALEAVQAERFVTHLMTHARTHFPEEVDALDDAALRAHLEQGVQQGQSFGLVTRQDLSRFINLLVACGWGLATTPEHAWMKAWLEDPDVSDPSARLDRVLKEFLRRGEVAARNAALREEFGQ